MIEHPTLGELVSQDFQIVAAAVRPVGFKRTSLFLQKGTKAYLVDNPAQMDDSKYSVETLTALHDQ